MPLSILLVALDPEFNNYGISANEFFEHFYNSRSVGSFTSDLAKCSLIRKGVGLQVQHRKGPTQFIINPCKGFLHLQTG